MQKLLAAALLSAAVFSAPAHAQTADRAAPAATAAASHEKWPSRETGAHPSSWASTFITRPMKNLATSMN